jgi:hypothetical protein
MHSTYLQAAAHGTNNARAHGSKTVRYGTHSIMIPLFSQATNQPRPAAATDGDFSEIRYCARRVDLPVFPPKLNSITNFC